MYCQKNELFYIIYENYLRKKVLLNTNTKFGIFCKSSKNTYQKTPNEKTIKWLSNLVLFVYIKAKTSAVPCMAVTVNKKRCIPLPHTLKIYKTDKIKKKYKFFNHLF